MLWQRKLDENAVHVVACVELRDDSGKFALAGLEWQMYMLGADAKLGRGFYLAADVDSGGRVFADTNYDQARRNSLRP